jgi:hypothetical protein
MHSRHRSFPWRSVVHPTDRMRTPMTVADASSVRRLSLARLNMEGQSALSQAMVYPVECTAVGVPAHRPSCSGPAAGVLGHRCLQRGGVDPPEHQERRSHAKTVGEPKHRRALHLIAKSQMRPDGRLDCLSIWSRGNPVVVFNRLNQKNRFGRRWRIVGTSSCFEQRQSRRSN